MKIVAYYDTWNQCSPDAFQHTQPHKEITLETPISELIEWQKNDNRNRRFLGLHEGEDFHPMKIVKMD